MGSSFRRRFMVALVLTALSQPSFARGAADEKDSGHEPKTSVGVAASEALRL